MSIQKTLTLSRWHVVADRLNDKIKEVQARTVSTFNHTNVGNFQGEEQVSMLNQRSALALQDVALIRRLIGTVGTIRERLAEANAQSGVTAKLSRLAAMQRDAKLLGDLTSVNNDSKVRVERLAEHFQEQQSGDAGQRRMSGAVSVVMLPDATKATWIAERDEMQSSIHALSDSINDLNRASLTIDLDEDIAKVAGI